MKFLLDPATLAFQLARAPFQLRDMASVPTQYSAIQCQSFLKSKSVGEFTSGDCDDNVRGVPTVEAFQFYMLNHAMSVLRQRRHVLEPLPLAEAAVAREYGSALATMTTRMFFYLLLICTREARHVKSGSDSIEVAKLAKKHGSDGWKFVQAIRGMDSEEAAKHFMNHPPVGMPLGPYVCTLTDVFNHLSFSSAYGGKAWGKIAECLREYVYGKITAEMMLDTSFTLAHNTAPIFNKGMLYEQQDANELFRILDLQSAGQIPALAFERHQAGSLDKRMQRSFNVCLEALPDVFTGYVDYYAVEAKGGAKKSYPMEKAAQAKKYGVPQASGTAVFVGGLKAKLAAQAEAAEAAKWITLYEGCQVKIVDYERAE